MGSGPSAQNIQIAQDIYQHTVNALTEELTSITSTTEQTANVNQTMVGIEIKQATCPIWMPFTGEIEFSNKTSVNLSAFTNLSSASSSSLAAKIQNEVNQKLGNKLKREKNGSLAFSDSTSNVQYTIVDTKITENIRTVIENKLQMYKNQTADAKQSYTNISVPTPCGKGKIKFSNEGVIGMVAKDMATVAVEAIMSTDTSNRRTAGAENDEEQKTTDIFGQLTGMFADMGAMAIAMVLGPFIIGIIIIVFIAIVKAATGGSSSSSNSNNTGGGGEGSGG